MYRLSAASASRAELNILTLCPIMCYTVNFGMSLTVPACQRGIVVQWGAWLRLTTKTPCPISSGQKFAKILDIKEENSEIQFSSIAFI